MEKLIRQLTHSNELFEKQWPDTCTRLDKASTSSGAKAILDAVVDYALAEPHDPASSQVKFIFVRKVIKRLVDEKLPITLDDVVQAFTKVLDAYTTGSWHLNLLETIYQEFRLGESLYSTPPKIHLIKLIFTSLQKKKEIMIVMRTPYQDFYRYALQHSHESSMWPPMLSSLRHSLSELHDNNDTSTDVPLDLSALFLDDAKSDDIYLLATSFENNYDLFKSNYTKMLETIERLILMDKFVEASYFVYKPIIKHFASVDLAPLLQMTIRLCSILANTTERRDLLCSNILRHLAWALNSVKANKKLAPLFFNFILATLELYTMDAPEYALKLLTKSEFYPWKELTSPIGHLIRICGSYDSIVGTGFFSKLDPLKDIFRMISDRAKTSPIIYRATHEPALKAIYRWSDKNTMYSMHVYKMGGELLDLIDQQQATIDICSHFIDTLRHRVSTDDDDDDYEDVRLRNAVFFQPMSARLAKFMEQFKTLPNALHQQFALFYMAALDRPLYAEDGNKKFEYFAMLNLWQQVAASLVMEDDARLYKTCLDQMYTRAYNDDDQDLKYWWTNFWTTVGMKLPQVAADHVEQFLVVTIDRKDMSFLVLLPMLYAKRPEPFHARFHDLVNELFADKAQNLASLGYLLWVITQEHPELISAKHLNYFFTSLQDISLIQSARILFQALIPVANFQPKLFDMHRAQLLRLVTEQQDICAFGCFLQYLIASVIVGGELTARENLDTLINLLKDGKISNEIQSSVFRGFHLIGVRYKQALVARRNDLVAFESNVACRSLLDYIDGTKMTEENQAAIKQAQEEMGQIEKRVVKTERDVRQVTHVVKQQELNITNIRTRVDVVDTRLTDVTEQVQVHGREIERIDAKTLSYVPEWGGEVSKLLNRRANNDWRLLGKRFGYSTSELRHWATKADPSMALLNEWYMTHKTDEATYGLVKMLGEIERHDAEKIIRQSVNAAGEAIPDELPFEIKRLPPVFLSYQWGTQAAVTTLKGHLEEAGYACWMDTGQMGGGDKLFAKIDAGIRGAKVVICCMTAAYAQSDNCSREVHLCVSTGKPIIPLQMEKQPWPPEGALGPIMSEYLFIRFFDRKSAGTASFWPEEKFAELLGQIRYHVAPDPDMISNRYSNWFAPQIDNLIFLQPSKSKEEKKKTEKDGPTLLTDTQLVVTHPQLMISYQWDHQAQIVALYKRLTMLGYQVWLDIFQMGGGDSLFEKIDTGIRHSLCVLACVTPKYTVSINCRREMALADALTKPIVPLLLQDASTWPPPGPMALVFADKPYVDFRRKNEQGDNDDIWAGQEFQHLLARLREVVPGVQTEKPQRSAGAAQGGGGSVQQRPERITSAHTVQQSQTCSLI